jgi:transposase-like protein
MSRIDFPKRPPSRDGLEDWYAAAFEQQKSSGIGVPAMAKELGVTTTTLYQWRRRLARKRGGSERPRRAQAPHGLVRLVVDQDGTRPDVGNFVVRLASDRRIEVPARFDDVDLRRLIGLLESC